MEIIAKRLGQQRYTTFTQVQIMVQAFSSSQQNEVGPVYSRIATLLQETFEPSHLEIEDESHMHASHAAMRNNEHAETHFKVTIVSDKFDSVSIVERHRLVNTALAAEMDATQGGTVHALSIKAKTPQQWAAAAQNR